LDYSKQYPIHPEQYIYEYLVNKYNIDIIYIPFKFNRVRASGIMNNDSIDINGQMVDFTKVKKDIPYKYKLNVLFNALRDFDLIWITLINLGYVDYTKNFLKSMEINNISFIFIVYCSDNESIISLKDFKNCICLHINSLGIYKDIPQSLQIYNSSEYKNIVFNKIDVIRLTMKESMPFGIKSVGFIDTDIVLLNDPSKVMRYNMNKYPNYQIFSQCNEDKCTNLLNCPKLNSGVIVYRNTSENQRLLNYSEDSIKDYKATQPYLIKKFNKLKIPYITIETDIFLNGLYPGIQECEPISLPPEACLIHYNWIIDDNYVKKKLMKSQNQWYID